MGNLLDRSRDDEVEDESIDQLSNHHGHHGYLYPPRSGCYFAGHFIMGGEKFETGQPEAYLFGDNMDLNFLGPKPIPFPYLAPLPDEPTRSLRVLVNIRKETLRLIKIHLDTDESTQPTVPASPNTPKKPTNTSNLKNSHNRIAKNNSNGSVKKPTDCETLSSASTTAIAPNNPSLQQSSSTSSLNSSLVAQQNRLLTPLSPTTDSSSSSSSTTSSSNGPLYTIEFTFDADVKCSITIYYLALEELTQNGITYVPREPSYKTETYNYPKGASQIFSQPSLIFNPSAFNEDDLLYRAIDEYGNFDPTVPFPIVIQVNAEEGSEPRQIHSLIATVERNNEKQFYIKPFKQKIIIDGLAYLIQEVYGIENKNTVQSNYGKNAYYSSDEEIEDNGSECVICMSESRDTLILPCRHLCLCNACADSLRYQANNCPICRSPFRALLQLRAVRKIPANSQPITTSAVTTKVTTTVTTTSSTTKTITTTKETTNSTNQSTIDHLNTSSSSSNNNNHNQSSHRHNASPSASRNSHPTSSARPITTNNNTTSAGETNDSKSDTPPGYESIPLIEALNGPPLIPSSTPRPGDYGLYAFQNSFDDEDVAPLASIEATTKSISGSSQSVLLIKDRDTLRQFKESIISNNKHTHRVKASSSSLSEIHHAIPSTSSPKLSYRSKSISRSKLFMMANSSESRSGNRENDMSSESLTLWSQQGSLEDGSEDHERVKLLDQGSSYSHPKSHSTHKQSTATDVAFSCVVVEPTRNRRVLRKRGSLCDDSELKALNSPASFISTNQQLEEDSVDAFDIDNNSINLSSNSYSDLFLRDGIGEQRFTDEADLLSVSTLDSVPNELPSKR